MKKLIKRLYNWMSSCVDKPYAELVLGLTFYLESCLLFLPTDPMLVIYCIEHRNKALRYAAIATISSVLGGITGYAIGFAIWNMYGQEIIHSKFINFIMSPEQFESACALYHKYEWWAVFIAGFTPIPYKGATLTAGFCKLSFIPLVFASIISRGARYYLYAIIIKFFGKRIKSSIDRYFNMVATLVLIIIVAVLWLLRQP